jgi:hypothetical protein
MRAGECQAACGWRAPSYLELAFVSFVGPEQAPFDWIADYLYN